MSMQGKRAWFKEARFGVFAHFGLYTLLGGNENEVRKGSKEKYAQLMKKFNPRRFSASEWVSQVKDSGAQYLVLTAKHAEGFCLWDSAHTPYKSTNTPCKRDFVAELAAACDKQKLRLGLYYNCNTWLNQREDGSEHDAASYPDFVEAQLRELLTNYGAIHLIWFDHRDPLWPLAKVRKVKKMIHDLQPTAVVNDRGVHTNKYPGLYCGDFVTPERHIPDFLEDDAPFVECCDAMGVRGWGYHKDERFWSLPELTRRLSRTASLGANYLLNVEPQPDGRIRPECVQRLQLMGEWVRKNSRAIFKTKNSPLTVVDPSATEHASLGSTTTNGKDVFLHLHKWPAADWVLVPNLKEKPARAYLLGEKKALTTALQEGQASSATSGFVPAGLQISGLPATPPSSNVAIIHLVYKHAPKIDLAANKRSQQKRVLAPAKHTVYLQPETAEYRAKGGVPWLTINRFSNGNVSVGHLIRAGCEIRWHLDVGAKTTYEVFADLGTIEQQAGASFSVSVGKEKIINVTKAESWYDTPVRTQLGQLSVDKGKRVLILRVLDMPGTFSDMHGTFSDVHGLVLQPVSCG